MKLVNPSENISTLVSLVKNARKFVVIVSPYNDLTGWDDLKNALNEASGRIDVSYYVRSGEGRKGLDGINVKVSEVPMLHAKMFFSESEALISSGNLTNRPDINWIGQMNTQGDYNEVVSFFESFIKPLSTSL